MEKQNLQNDVLFYRMPEDNDTGVADAHKVEQKDCPIAYSEFGEIVGRTEMEIRRYINGRFLIEPTKS